MDGTVANIEGWNGTKLVLSLSMLGAFILRKSAFSNNLQ
jgi:hypothetical protein